MLSFMLKVLFLELMGDHFVLDVLFKYLKRVPPISGEDWLLWEALWFEWEIRLFSTAVSTSVLMTYFSSCFFLWWALTQTSWEFSSVIGSFLLDPGSIPLYLDSITKTVFGFALEAEPRVGCLHTTSVLCPRPAVAKLTDGCLACCELSLEHRWHRLFKNEVCGKGWGFQWRGRGETRRGWTLLVEAHIRNIKLDPVSSIAKKRTHKQTTKASKQTNRKQLQMDGKSQCGSMCP